MPFRDDRGHILAALSLWTVGDDDGNVLAKLKSRLPLATKAATDIQVKIGHRQA